MTAAATLRGFLPACTSRRDRRPARDARVASGTDDRRVSAGGTPGPPSEARRCQGTGAWGSGVRRVSIAPIRCVSTPAKTSGSQSSQKTRPDPSLVDVRESTVSNELRAAAAARSSASVLSTQTACAPVRVACVAHWRVELGSTMQ